MSKEEIEYMLNMIEETDNMYNEHESYIAEMEHKREQQEIQRMLPIRWDSAFLYIQ